MGGRDPARPGSETKKLKQKWASFATRGEAEAYRAQVVSQVNAGGYTAPTKITTRAFLEDWLEKYAAGAVGPVTLAGYRDIVLLRLAPALWHIPLARLTPGAIQGYYTEKLAAGLSSTTVHAHHRVLREALGHAMRWGLLARNPATLTNPPRKQRYAAVVWDEEQVRLFLAKAKRESPYYPLYLTAILTGMGQGELLGLRWEDVDLALGIASIKQTFYRLNGNRKQQRKGQLLFKAPKTDGSRRIVALPPAVVDALREVRDTQREQRAMLGEDYHDHDLVFCQPTGKPLHVRNMMMRDFHPTAEAAKVPRCRFHDLRHAHISYLAMAGVSPKVAQERVGHATSRFTLDVYTHTLPGMQADGARRVEALLLGTNEAPSPLPE